MKGAHIHQGVTVGARTQVWQFASLIRRAVIGEDCRIAAYATVDGSRVGNRTILSNGAFVSPGMVIGDDVFLGPGVVMCNDAWPRAGKDGFDAEEFISGRLVTSRVCSGASLCSKVTVLPGVVIGAFAMVAAGVVVDCDVPEWHLFKRNGQIVPIDKEKQNVRMRTV